MRKEMRQRSKLHNLHAVLNHMLRPFFIGFTCYLVIAFIVSSVNVTLSLLWLIMIMILEILERKKF